MEQESSSDHLSSSLTDLMTSLMVIFILLLLVFVSRTAGRDAAVTDKLLKELQSDMKLQDGAEKPTIRQDEHDKNAILIIVPSGLMNFDNQDYHLQEKGKIYLTEHIPHLAGLLCGKNYRSSIDSIVVEGHTDKNRYGRTDEESRNNNLRLSQERSMAVVEESLANLRELPEVRDCFLEKLSATGRGDREPEATDDQSRRVIFRIRIKARDADNTVKEIKQ